MNKNIDHKILSWIFLVCLVGLCTNCAPTQDTLNEISTYPVTKGVSAPFAGFIGDRMFVGGGCNFPEIPASEGGAKKFYRDAYFFDKESSSQQWIKTVPFPTAIAYGASVETEKGLLCIGGMNEDSSLTSVYRVEVNDKADGLTVNGLPSLPEPIDNAAAASVGNVIYVTGGNQGNGGNSLYALRPGEDVTWEKLADYPGPKRIQPVLLGTDTALYLLGGFSVEAESKQAVISSDYLVYEIAKDRWSEPQPIPTMSDGSPRAMVGCSGVRIDNKLVIAGGVNYAIFKSAVEGKAPQDYLKKPEAWYQFSKDLLIYDLNTSTWKVIPEVEGMNKAGGCLLQNDGVLYMVCGEVKPGVRTSDIVSYQLPVENLK